MYKDKEAQKVAARERVRRYRDKQKSVTQPTECNAQTTKDVTPNVTPYNPLMTHLTDPIKRRKLQAICDAFANSPYGKKITFGYHGANLDEVRQMLDLTAGLKI